MRLWRKYFSSMRPGSSSPTTPTGSTFTPRSARLLAALAAPPGTTLRSRCFRISTGASRDTREISPKTNSSATRSPSTVTVILGNDSAIFLRRSASLGCLVIFGLGAPFLASCARSGDFHRRRKSSAPSVANSILSRAALSLPDLAQHGIHSVSCVRQFHFHRHHGKRLQRGKIRPEIDRVFLGSQEPAGLALLFEGKQLNNILLDISVMIAVERLGHGLDVRRPQLQHEILR